MHNSAGSIGSSRAEQINPVAVVLHWSINLQQYYCALQCRKHEFFLGLADQSWRKKEKVMNSQHSASFYLFPVIILAL